MDILILKKRPYVKRMFTLFLSPLIRYLDDNSKLSNKIKCLYKAQQCIFNIFVNLWYKIGKTA